MTLTQRERLRRLTDYLKRCPGAHKRDVYRSTGVSWDEFPNIVKCGAEHDCYLDESALKELKNNGSKRKS